MKINNKQQQHGLASIIIVFMLTIIISLLTLGFSRLMDRAIQQSTGNDLNAAADYAVRVGINEAASYLKAFPGNGASNCDDLTKAGQPLSKAGGLSGDENVKYSCVLINTSPSDIFYQLLTPYKSQVSKLSPDQNMDQMMISWQASDRTKNVYPAANGTAYDETQWGDNNYPPVIRLTLYPLSGQKGSKAWENLKANIKTYYLFPSASNPTGNSSVPISMIDFGNSSSSTAIKASVNCGTTKKVADTNGLTFVGKTDYDCNLIFFNLPQKADSKDGAYAFYARITPLYTTGTNFRIQGQSGQQLVKFANTQSIVDVTAKAGNAAKRLQARVNIISSEFVDPQLRPSEDAAPEYAVLSAQTICKVFVVPKNSKNTDVAIPDNVTTGAYANACPTDYPASE